MTFRKLTALFLLGSQMAFAAGETRIKGGLIVPGSAAIGSSASATTSAILDTVSTTKGARPCPSMTQTQRDAIATPATGLCVYNTTTNAQNQYNGTAWVAVGSGSGFGDQRLSNGDFEGGTSNYTASTGTFTTQSATLFAGNASGKWVLSSATGSLSQDVTPAQPLQGVNLEASCWVDTTVTTAQVCARQAGSEVKCVAAPSTGTWQKVAVNMVGPSSGSIGVDVSTTGSTTGTIYVDQCYVGSATNLSQVSQAQIYGSILSNTNGSCVYANSNGTSYSSFGAQASCPAYTVTDNATAPGTQIPAIVFPTMPPGKYEIQFQGITGTNANSTSCTYRLTDGTNNSPDYGYDSANGSGVLSAIGPKSDFTWYQTYTTAQSNVTIQLQAKNSGAGSSCALDGSRAAWSIHVKYWPSQSQTALTANQAADSQESHVGIAGYGSTNTTVLRYSTNSVTRGTDITYNASSISGDSWTINAAGQYCMSGALRESGGGNEWDIGRNVAGTINTDPAGTATTSTGDSGWIAKVGTIAGQPAPILWCGYLAKGDVIVTAIKAGLTFSTTWFTIAKVNNSSAAPLLVGSVTSNTSGMERIERATVVCGNNGSSAITSQSGSWVASIANGGATGQCSLSLTAGIFSATPTCTCSPLANATANNDLCYPATISTSTIKMTSILSGSPTDGGTLNIVCMGPR